MPSTAGLNPVLIWQSRPLATREEAARFEASMKSLRDQRNPRFQEIVGYPPIPFQRPPRLARAGCFGLISLLALLLILTLSVAILPM